MWRVFYDADCGICSRLAGWMRRWVRREDVVWRSVTSEEARRLVPERPADEMAVVGPGGEVWLGFDGVIAVLRLAGWRRVAGVVSLPGIYGVFGVGYRLTARNRWRISRLLGLRVCAIAAEKV